MYVCVNNWWKIRERYRDMLSAVLYNVLLYDNNDVQFEKKRKKKRKEKKKKKKEKRNRRLVSLPWHLIMYV